jgi:hypothetical protein
MEDLKKSTIEDLPVVSSVGFHTGDKTHNQESMPNSCAVQCHRMEVVV